MDWTTLAAQTTVTVTRRDVRVDLHRLENRAVINLRTHACITATPPAVDFESLACDGALLAEVGRTSGTADAALCSVGLGTGSFSVRLADTLCARCKQNTVSCMSMHIAVFQTPML